MIKDDRKYECDNCETMATNLYAHSYYETGSIGSLVCEWVCSNCKETS